MDTKLETGDLICFSTKIGLYSKHWEIELYSFEDQHEYNYQEGITYEILLFTHVCGIIKAQFTFDSEEEQPQVLSFNLIEKLPKTIEGLVELKEYLTKEKTTSLLTHSEKLVRNFAKKVIDWQNAKTT